MTSTLRSQTSPLTTIVGVEKPGLRARSGRRRSVARSVAAVTHGPNSSSSMHASTSSSTRPAPWTTSMISSSLRPGRALRGLVGEHRGHDVEEALGREVGHAGADVVRPRRVAGADVPASPGSRSGAPRAWRRPAATRASIEVGVGRFERLAGRAREVDVGDDVGEAVVFAIGRRRRAGRRDGAGLDGHHRRRCRRR